jgi:hypothetical protein
MKRREFIALLGGAAAAWPFGTRAQPAANVPRVGFLGFGSPDASGDRAQALRAGLHDLGYVEGKNIVIEFRWAETVDQFPELAAELVRMNVDVIFALSSIEVEAARRATKTIPIVFAFHADPLGIGHVTSLARPGGNITGLTMLATDLAAKQLEILKEAVPRATRIGVVWHPATPSPTCLEGNRGRWRKARGQAPHDTSADHPGPQCCVLDHDTRARGLFPRRRIGVLSASARRLLRTRIEAPTAGNVPDPGVCRGGRPHELFRGPERPDPARRCLRRQDIERR